MRRAVAAGTVLALTAALGGCSALPSPGGGGYRMSAYFAKAPSLYEESRVKVLGADVGTVTSIKVEGSRVRVDFTVDDGVPVPADVHASIEAAETLGDRSIVLTPAWKAGTPKAAPNSVIPQERTTLPVEIDEALEAFTRLNSAVDPGDLRGLLHEGAQALDGNGQSLNDAIGLTSELVNDLAGQDRKLVQIATGLRDLAADLNGEDLGATIDAFAAASGMLAGERDELRAFLTGLANVIRKSGVLITAYQETLPATAADLSNIVMTLKSGSGSINEVIRSLSRFADVVVNSWDRKNHVAVIRLQLTATVRAWLQPIFTAMGWGAVPCPAGSPALADCPKKRKAP